MKTSLTAVLLTAALATTANADILVEFTGAQSDGPPTSPTNPSVTFAGNDTDPAVPAIVTVNIDALGNVTGSVASNNNTVTDGWTVSGTTTSGFGTSLTLTMSATANGIPSIIRQINTGGLGVPGGAAARITGASDEQINVAVDASGVAVTDQLSLTSVGFINTNAIGPTVPDLVVTPFAGADLVFEDLITGTSGTLGSPIAVSGVDLIGGGGGTLGFSQAEVANVGYSLSSLSFDVTVIPEPSSLILASIASLFVLRGRKIRN